MYRIIRQLIFASCLLSLFNCFAQSPHIHVDQFGYTPLAEKFAVLTDPVIGQNSNLSYTPGSTIEVRDSETDAVVASFSPDVWDDGNVDTYWSGDRGWWVNFSTVTDPGTYYIYDPSNDQSSAVFEIGNQIYDDVLEVATKMFYYNRCNDEKAAPYAGDDWTDGMNFLNPLQDSECRYIHEPNNGSLEKDLRGGWFDAGDNNKYVTFTYTTVHDLLWAYQENEEVFTDNFNIPESGNGIPDLLDEIKWELDWLRRMTNPDGSVHIKMGNQNYAENVNYPPSANTDQRFYGPTCTSASVTVASLFAHAYTVYKDIDGLESFADDLLLEAEAAWDYVMPYFEGDSLEYFCDLEEIVSGDADFNNYTDYLERLLGASVYLFEATGSAEYDDFFQDFYLQSIVFGSTQNIPGEESTYYDEQWDVNYNSDRDAFLLYGTLPGHNPDVAQDLYDSFDAMQSNNWEGYYGISELDLFRAHLPNYFLTWGSNQNQGKMGNMNLNIPRYGLDGGSPEDYYQKAAGHIHYVHGVNPLGKVYLSNMYDYGADKCVDEIYHFWFADGSDWDNVQDDPYGPAPGYLSGGPNHTYSGGRTPPTGEPFLKAYDDFNDVPSKSWEITEPAIYYQAAYIRLLANVMSRGKEEGSTANIEVSEIDIEIYPDPVDDYFVLKGDLGLYDIDVLNAAGQVILEINTSSNEEIIDVSNLSSGLHFVRLVSSNPAYPALSVQKIIKQ